MPENYVFYEKYSSLVFGYMYVVSALRKGEMFPVALVELQRLVGLEISTVLHCDLWREYFDYLNSSDFNAAVGKLIARRYDEKTYEERLRFALNTFSDAMRKHSRKLSEIYRSEYYLELSRRLPPTEEAGACVHLW